MVQSFFFENKELCAHAGASTTAAAAPMSLPAEPAPPPPPHADHEHETLIQYNLRNKVCAYCKRPGAHLKCEGCRQRSYCDRKCQKKDWKQEHRGQCVKLQQVFTPSACGRKDSAAETSDDGGGGGSVGGGGGCCLKALLIREISSWYFLSTANEVDVNRMDNTNIKLFINFMDTQHSGLPYNAPLRGKK